MPPHHPSIAQALGSSRATLERVLQGRPGRLMVACSGGADSIALLGLCDLLRHSLGLELTVGHVDHGLRPASSAEARLVTATAQRMGLDCSVARLELDAGPGLPARARAARRAALSGLMEEHGASGVLLGHTATDQTETMLMHLVRGTGLDGIAAMSRVDLPWIRPLLDLTRAQTREVAQRLELEFVDDPSNDDPRHFRVFLRREVLPAFAAENPRVEAAFIGAADQAREAETALVEWAERERERRHRGGHHWALEDFDRLPKAVRTRVVRIICDVGGVDLASLKRRVIDAIDAAAVAQAAAIRPPRTGPGVAPKRWDLHPSRCLEVEKDGIFVRPPPEPNH